jgi:hypothetical protein
MFKKKQAKKLIFASEIAKSIVLWSGPKSLCSRRLFECLLAVQSASPQMWKVFKVNWATPWVMAAGETDARHSVSSQLVKCNIIGATIFMTFRTQIHTKKFGKNGFRNLQGTMSHRPLTNTSSLKITAAYCTLHNTHTHPNISYSLSADIYIEGLWEKVVFCFHGSQLTAFPMIPGLLPASVCLSRPRLSWWPIL